MKTLIRFLLFYIAFFIFQSAFAQNPLIKKWDARFGGTSDDLITCFQQTADSGYILGGYSMSGMGGDKTQPLFGSNDYWVVKIDSVGVKQWDKVFGGNDYDELYAIQQTSDGGYILGGYSISTAGGNKSQSTVAGSYDYWIVKIDSLGNIQWDKDFGGTDYDKLTSIQETTDGGYILGGYSYSGIGGDKTNANWGDRDYWVIKTDSLGIKQWDKDFGGTSADIFCTILQTIDGGYMLGGYSHSGIGGDKTQPVWGGYPDADYWIVKIDSAGIKEWDKDFGGTEEDFFNSIVQTYDGGYILGGYSASGISGDKTQLNQGYRDYWIVKTDSLGIKLWDKDFGGAIDEDAFGNISQTSDRGYLISGTSYSNASGDKSEDNSLGGEQTWLVRTDSLGNLKWDKTILSPGHDELGFAVQTNDGCYAIASQDPGGIGGYKSQAAWNNSNDYWIVKFCDSIRIAAIFTAPNHVCPGSCLSFTNLSINATSYQWSFQGATPFTSIDQNPSNICYSTPGNYDVQLIASNIYGSDTIILMNYINVFPFPAPQSITQSGDSLFAIAGSASYQWYFNTNLISGATNYFYVAQASGEYNVVATDVNGCEVEAAIFNVVAGLQSTVDSGLLTIFPNPVEDKFTMHIPITIGTQFTSETAIEISVYNVLGEKVYLSVDRLPIAIGMLTVDCRHLSPGLYFIEITTAEKSFRSKFVKQ